MAKKPKFFTNLTAAADGEQAGHLLLLAVSHQMPDPVADLNSYLVDWELHAKPAKYKVLLDGGKMFAEYPSMFDSMVRDPAGTIYIGEDDGFVRYRDGKAEVVRLQAVAKGITSCAYVRAADSVVFGTSCGHMVHVDGSNISATRIVTSKARIKDDQTDVSSIHGLGRDFMVAVGIRGLVSCYREGKWATVRPPADIWFHAVFCRTKTEIYIGGNRGGVWRWDGDSRWTRLKSEVSFGQDVMTFCDFAEYQGKLYAACVEYGIFWLDGDLWRPIGRQKDEVVGLLTVTKAGLVGLGALWGTPGSWLTVYDGKTWTVEQVHIPPQ